MAELKREAPEEMLVVLGSGELLRALLRDGLVDELMLSIFPLVLGSRDAAVRGRRRRAELELRESVTTTTA